MPLISLQPRMIQLERFVIRYSYRSDIGGDVAAVEMFNNDSIHWAKKSKLSRRSGVTTSRDHLSCLTCRK